MTWWWHTLAFWYDSTMTLKLIFPFCTLFIFFIAYALLFRSLNSIIELFFWTTANSLRFSDILFFSFLSFSYRFLRPFPYNVLVYRLRPYNLVCSGRDRSSVDVIGSVKMPTEKCAKHLTTIGQRITWFDTDCFYVRTNRFEWASIFLNFLISSSHRIHFARSVFFFSPSISFHFILDPFTAEQSGDVKTGVFLSSVQFDLVIWLSHTTSLATTCMHWQCCKPAPCTSCNECSFDHRLILRARTSFSSSFSTCFFFHYSLLFSIASLFSHSVSYFCI